MCSALRDRGLAARWWYDSSGDAVGILGKGQPGGGGEGMTGVGGGEGEGVRARGVRGVRDD